ncbi:hypothetical protein Nepgr_014236 [Nepenthes gracilis]|uniref:Uncharacterized protein n=1 Tax=Nepenthes gracilis TaxID=150966 RepID=A0AAD3SIT0_NEPGR|nr:hypothetical protein Nepgr_014236 [Nepenthes gracilis]
MGGILPHSSPKPAHARDKGEGLSSNIILETDLGPGNILTLNAFAALQDVKEINKVIESLEHGKLGFSSDNDMSRNPQRLSPNTSYHNDGETLLKPDYILPNLESLSNSGTKLPHLRVARLGTNKEISSRLLLGADGGLTG